IGDALGVRTVTTTIQGLPNTGSFLVHAGDKGMVPPDTTPQERTLLAKALGLTLEDGTVNMGNSYLRSGIVSNKHGFLISDASGGPEIVNADQALGFLE
ncbi:MAG: translation initiation factor 6, partial [Nitrosarchaeum sp.]|nr:translation initiation factor 6 [Nitrosarchaeum sp.]